MLPPESTTLFAVVVSLICSVDRSLAGITALRSNGSLGLLPGWNFSTTLNVVLPTSGAPRAMPAPLEWIVGMPMTYSIHRDHRTDIWVPLNPRYERPPSPSILIFWMTRRNQSSKAAAVSVQVMLPRTVTSVIRPSRGRLIAVSSDDAAQVDESVNLLITFFMAYL